MVNAKAKEKNVILYPTYKMFSWDMLFYYAIIFLFFTQVKGISAADVLLAESFYPIFKLLFLAPATILINKIGKRKSLIVGNVSIAISTLIYILAVSFNHILLGQLLQAIGFIIKGICESNVLYDSLERNEKRGSRFSKIDGKATSMYYYIDSFSAVISGFLFAINGYLPMIFCLFVNILSIILATKFEEIDDIPQENKTSIGKEFRNISKSVKSIFSSPRLKNLVTFGAMFSGILYVLITLRSSILSDIGVLPQYFGIIFAVLGIISGISAKNQNKFHKKFKNTTLANLSIPVVVSCMFLGIFCNIGLGFVGNIIIVLSVFLIHYIVRGPFYTLIKRYMNNFTTSTLRIKISSSFNLLENLFRALISFFASFLLRYTTTANTFIIMGCIFTVIIVLMLDNMRTKVGLKPEQYKEKDTKILELK